MRCLISYHVQLVHWIPLSQTASSDLHKQNKTSRNQLVLPPTEILILDVQLAAIIIATNEPSIHSSASHTSFFIASGLVASSSRASILAIIITIPRWALGALLLLRLEL